MSSLPLFTALILDLGDVLLTWSPDTKSSVSPHILKAMLSSTTWMNYERGRLSEYGCYARLSAEFAVPKEDIASAFQQARGSLRVNEGLAALVQELKASDKDLQVYALSNISIPDFSFVQKLPFEWSTFDAVFPSGLLGERKPDKAIYDRLIAGTGVDPSSAVFVDDKAENVAVARTLGMHGIVFDLPDKVASALRGLFSGPLQRGARFMRAHACTFESITDDGRAFMDNFSQLLILELTGDMSLVSFPEKPFLWNFFQENPAHDEGMFPDDIDTTAIAYTVLDYDLEYVQLVMNEILKYKTDQGTFLSYFDPTRTRMDPFVNINVLTFFIRNGRGEDVPEALDYVLDVLASRRYLDGSRYYCSPEMYLYFLSRLLDSDAAVRARAMPVFVERLRERVGVPADDLDRAMRVIVCCKLGVENEVDLRALLASQRPDGDWEVGWLYKYGKSGIRIGNRGVTTAFAIRAIQMATQQATEPLPL